MRSASEEHIQTVNVRWLQWLMIFFDVSCSTRCVPSLCLTPAQLSAVQSRACLLSTHRGWSLSRMAFRQASSHAAWTRRGRKGGDGLGVRWRRNGRFMYRFIPTFFFMCAGASCGVLVCQNECVDRSCEVDSDRVRAGVVQSVHEFDGTPSPRMYQ